MLTRPQFDRACKLLVQEYESSRPSFVTNALRGWLWTEHPSVCSLGYLSRNSNYLSRHMEPFIHIDSNDNYTEIDEAAAPICIDTEALTSQQYVVYSATFQVPCFYFTMYHSNGAPLPINELLSSTLFRPGILQDANTTTFALTRRNTAFPLLSQGDHPTTGKPCWFLHPCETTIAVEELLKEVEKVADSEDAKLLSWLKMWFVVLGSIIDLA
ncbi:hypothetical protein F5050DRAFT_1737524 [Lentinula boryana]|uniref:Ubiquitin-like-conjugating enzyme ATG10 n=1 Tax=Lentinula boryana TaxID=40481 RepID=A0ABQ8QLW9_9AGAR|nr:hypothetical protein F5050DRAFT_1737524 [Lentinula boryana]